MEPECVLEEGKSFSRKLMNAKITIVSLNFRFAEQDIYVFLATILRQYKLGYAIGETMDSVYNTLLFPDRTLRVKFEPRDTSQSI